MFSGLPETMGRLWATTGDPSSNAMGVTWAGIIMGRGFVLSFGYWTTDFLVVQRAFSSKDLRSAQLTPINASFFKMALPFIIVVAGLISWRLTQTAGSGFQLLPHPETGEPWNDTALPLLIARYYPPGLVGLGITALLAGFMAGQAGNVSAFNTVWTYDIYRVLIKKDASDEHLVYMGRVTTIVGILLSVATAYLAMQFNTIMDYIQAIFSWVNAPLFATMLLGMFWKRATPTAGFWGNVAGMATSFSIFLGLKMEIMPTALIRLLTFSDNPSGMAANLWQATWAWVVCFVVTVIMSFMSKPKPEAELEGLVKGLTEPLNMASLPLPKRPGFWAAWALAAVVLLNIIFW